MLSRLEVSASHSRGSPFPPDPTPIGPGGKAPWGAGVTSPLFFPGVELEPVDTEAPLGWGLEKLALHPNFTLHSVGVSQGLCPGWTGAACVWMAFNTVLVPGDPGAGGTACSSPAPGPKCMPSTRHPPVPAQGQRGAHSQALRPALHAHTASKGRRLWVPPRADTGGQAAPMNKQSEGFLPTACPWDLGWALRAARPERRQRSGVCTEPPPGVRPVGASPGLP